MTFPRSDHPKVFISYSHDSHGHMDQVLVLSNRLRADGIDCHIDQYEESPPEGWPRWMVNQIEKADFVLVVCTETYEHRFRGKEGTGKGLGVKWEGAILTQELYEAEANNTKFIPVLFSSHDSTHIPIALRSATYYELHTEEGYERLYRRLTRQPRVLKPELGKPHSVPPLAQLSDDINQGSFDPGHLTQFEPTFLGLCLEVIRANFPESDGFKVDYYPLNLTFHLVRIKNSAQWLVQIVSEIPETQEKALQSIVSFFKQNIEAYESLPDLILCINVPHDHSLNHLCQTELKKLYANKFQIWQIDSLLVKAKTLSESKFQAYLQLALKPRAKPEEPENVYAQEENQGASSGSGQGIQLALLKDRLMRREDELKKVEKNLRIRDREIEELRRKETQIRDESQQLKTKISIVQASHRGAKKLRLWVWGISFLASILVAIGVNRITTDLMDQPGVIFLIAGVVLHVVNLRLTLATEDVQTSITHTDTS